MYDLSRDVQLLETAQIDVVFIPRPEDIYPPTFSTYVMTSGPLVESLECALFKDQPYFVSTLFTRLLLLIRPDIAYFGQKSAQYAALMRRLIHDLSIDTSLRVLPTVREGDGLALSCDNVLLSPAQRQAAPLLYRALLNAKALIEQGERQVPFLKQTMAQIIASSPLLRLDYAAICDPSTFHELDVLPDLTPTLSSPGFILSVAAYADTVRLIDNIQFASNGYWLM
jgi:pantoate--beta-alanine ligase